jgi:general secretion pathway protein E
MNAAVESAALGAALAPHGAATVEKGWPGLPTWSIDALHAMTVDVDAIDFARASRRRVLFGHLEGRRCVVVGAGAAESSWDWLQGRVSDDARVGVVDDADFDAMLARRGAGLRAMDSVSSGDGAGPAGEAQVEELGLAALAAEPNPAVRLLGSTLFDAFRSHASDVHLESTPLGARIQFRLDGVLAPGGAIEGRALAEQVVSRIKVLGGLDVGERRLPQDGRFRLRIDGRDVDFRVSLLPGAHGEDAVLRILDRRALADEHAALDLERLGFGTQELEALRALARRRQDDDAVRRADRGQQRSAEDHHDRGPGRVPAAGRAAGAGERAHRAHLRARAPGDPAPRSRHAAGRRDP